MATVKLVVKFKQYQGRFRIEWVRRLTQAGELLKRQTQINIGRIGGPGRRSKPGGYPHLDTGRLQDSIYSKVDTEANTVAVGTDVPYAKFLEYGTAGPRTVFASPGKTLSWIGPGGKRYFAKSVRIPPLAPRPFLGRALADNAPALRAIFEAPMPDFNVM